MDELDWLEEAYKPANNPRAHTSQLNWCESTDSSFSEDFWCMLKWTSQYFWYKTYKDWKNIKNQRIRRN